MVGESFHCQEVEWASGNLRWPVAWQISWLGSLSARKMGWSESALSLSIRRVARLPGMLGSKVTCGYSSSRAALLACDPTKSAGRGRWLAGSFSFATSWLRRPGSQILVSCTPVTFSHDRSLASGIATTLGHLVNDECSFAVLKRKTKRKRKEEGVVRFGDPRFSRALLRSRKFIQNKMLVCGIPIWRPKSYLPPRCYAWGNAYLALLAVNADL